MVDAAREQGLLIITAGKGDIVRLVPPLTVTDDEIDTCCRILADVVKVLARPPDRRGHPPACTLAPAADGHAQAAPAARLFAL